MPIKDFFNLKSLLFDGQTVKQAILKNSFWLAITEGIERFLKLFLIIYVTRILGAVEYGKFTFVLSFVSLFLVFPDLSSYFSFKNS